MKKILFLFLTTAIFFQVKAQSIQSGWCGTMINEHNISQKHPEYLEQFNNLVQIINSNRDSVRQAMQSNQEYTDITIPVVFHIMSYNWSGNISDAQVIDAVRVINEDFNKLNADTSQVRNIFKPYIADCKIHFKLARIDPQGNCTKGITRTNTQLTNGADDNIKSLIDWDPSKYFNIWVVNSINLSGNTNVGGYAQFPSWGTWPTYGVVIRNDMTGTIGTAASSDGHALSHEIGHCFNLYHTFESGCGSNCSTSGDEVCDTPPQAQAFTYSCDSNRNSCSNDMLGPSPFTMDMPDQNENFMSYSFCDEMFTIDQNVRMHSTIASTTELQDLIANSNLIATGTNTGYTPQLCAPIADFKWNNNMICQGDSVKYTNESYNGQATTWNWTFQGGAPGTSNDSNVTITYNTAGTFNTTLNVSNTAGSNAITKTGIILVSSSAAQYNNWIYYDSFENATLFGNDWIIVNPGGNNPWKRITGLGATGSACIMLENDFLGDSGEVAEIISPSYDFTAVSQPVITFKVAFAQQEYSNSDVLRVYLSTDCGRSWQLRYAKASTALATIPYPTNYYAPASSSEWRTETIMLPGSYYSKSNVRLKFQFTNGGGDNIYIDDINIQPATGIEKQAIADNSFKIYPNPAQETAHINFNLLKETQNVSLTLTDMLGKKVAIIFDNATLQKGKQSIKLDLKSLNLPKGVYFIRLKTAESKTLVRKLIVD